MASEFDMIINPLTENYDRERDRGNKGQKQKYLNEEDVFNRVGALGLFQLVALPMTFISFVFEGYILYPLAYVALMPDYICVGSNGDSFHCSNSDTCEPKYNTPSFDGNMPGYYVNYANQTSLINWVEPLGLRCAADWQVGFLGASYFIGNVVGSSTLSKYGDTFGRIKLIRLGFTISIVLYAAMIYLMNYKLIVYLLLFLLGFLSCIRLNFSFIYGSEIIKTTHATVICSFYNFFDGFTMVQASIYFKFISKDWFYLYWYFLSICMIGTLISFFMPESPRYLISIGDFKRARESFEFISKMNGKKPLDPQLERFVEELEYKSKKPQHQHHDHIWGTENQNYNQDDLNDLTTISSKSDFWSLFTIKMYVINIIMMNIAWSASSFTYYMVGFYIKYIPGDIFQNVMISSLSESIACLISGFLALLLGTKNTLIMCFLIGGTFGLALAFVDPHYETTILLCLLLTKFGVSSSLSLCFLVTSEYFPIIYSATVFGACNIFARVISIFAPLIAEINPPLPMIIYGVFCFMSVLGTSFLSKDKRAGQAIDDALYQASPLNRNTGRNTDKR
eukprot:403334998